MKVIIAGSRNISDFDLLKRVIGFTAFKITEVVSGCAKGVDSLGERWAKENNIPITRFKPDWDKFGMAAGPKRNLKMAVYADALIAIWDGQSAGTRHMAVAMIGLGKPLYVHRIEPHLTPCTTKLTP